MLYMLDQKKKLSIKCMWMTQKRREMIDVLSSEPHSVVLSTQPHECIVHKHCWRPVEADRGRKMPAVSFKACYQGIQIPLHNKLLTTTITCQGLPLHFYVGLFSKSGSIYVSIAHLSQILSFFLLKAIFFFS